MPTPNARSFQVHDCLGRGGVGEVYHATMTTAGGLESEVALKVIRREVGFSNNAIQRLRDEGKLLARLGHPAILKVHDLCVLEGRVTLITEYVAGEDLTRLMQDDGIGTRALLEVLSALAQALDAAWNNTLQDGRRLNLVHRDIKPSNIRVGRHGEVKLLDFGIARTDALNREARTQTDAMIGSLLYMAPERFVSNDLDPAADVWSLGAILYEALYGTRFYGQLGLPQIAGMAMERQRYDSYLTKRFQTSPTIGSGPWVELASSLLQHDPRQRPTANDLATATETLAHSLDGDSLTRWCRSRAWRDGGRSRAEMSGRTLTEGSTTRRPVSLDGRFRIEGQIGQGGFGQVYRAYDNKRGTYVALKTLERADSKSLYRFKNEFRSLAELVHPNLVQLHELFFEEGQWFFSMELIHGATLMEYLQAEPGFFDAKGALSARYLDRIQRTMTQLADAMVTLHRSGLIHCDLKPGNVMVTDEGRVVVLDFGLVRAIQYEPSSNTGSGLVGTPRYMAPEQAAGGPILAAADWYSFGVMLYEALTGTSPFAGGSAWKTIWRQKTEPIRSIHEIVEGVPDHLDQLCADLLRADPNQRPSPLQISSRLAPQGTETAQDATATAPSQTQHFVGREAQLATLEAALAISRQGEPALVFVRGRSGMGKTALIQHFLSRESQRDGLVIGQGRSYQQESVPFKAWDEVIDSLTRYLRELPFTEIEPLIPRRVLELIRMFPVLGHVEAFAQASEHRTGVPDPQETRRRAFGALRSLLGRIRAREPLVLFLDDLQWGDLDSSLLVRELIWGEDAPGVMLVGAYRSDEVEGSPMLQDLLGRDTDADAPRIFDIEVAELPDGWARDLVARNLAGTHVSEQRIQQLVNEAKGIPYFLLELVQGANDGNPKPVLQSETSITLDEMIRRRVSTLPDSARHLLEAVAIAGRPTAPDVAAAAAGHQDAPLKSVALLRMQHFVKIRMAETGDQIVPYHDRIRESVVSGIDPERARDLHLALAHALQTYQDSDPEVLAYHFQRGGEEVRAGHFALLAGHVAFDSLAFDRAARHYRFVLDLGHVDANDAHQIQVRLGEALANAGRGPESAEAYLKAAEELDAAQALVLKQRAAFQLLWSGHVEAGVDVIRGVLHAVGMQLPTYNLPGMLMLGLRRAWLRVRGLSFTQRSASDIDPDTLVRIDTHGAVANAMVLADTRVMADFLTRYLLHALDAGEPGRVAIGIAWESWLQAFWADKTRSYAALSLATQLADRSGSAQIRGRVKAIAGLPPYWADGHFARALVASETARDFILEHCVGLTFDLVTSQNNVALCLGQLGRFKELNRRLPELIRDARERGDIYAEYMFVCTEALTWSLLSQDRADTLRQEKERTFERSQSQADAMRTFHWFLMQTDIALYSGDGEQAWSACQQSWDSVRRVELFDAPLVRGLAWYTYGRCALAGAAVCEGNAKQQRIAQAQQAAKRLSKLNKLAFAPGTEGLIRAGIASILGSDPTAITLLERASDHFGSVEMQLHRAVCQRRLAALTGGDEGACLLRESDRWMTSEEVRAPERMANWIAPGAWAR